MADDYAAAAAEAKGTQARTIEFHGETFAIADKFGIMPLMDFARACRSGMDTAHMDALAAMSEILEDCLVPEDWARFRQLCRVNKLQNDDILVAVKELISAVSANPTSEPSDSSDGQSTTSESSKASSSEPASLEERKRAMGLVPVPDVLSSVV